MEAQAIFAQLLEEYKELEGVTEGKMMSAPAMQYQGKVFAFFHKGAMTFKLGKQFDPEAFGLEAWSYLSPFKNKPPMKAWVVVPEDQQAQWPFLTNLAYETIKR